MVGEPGVAGGGGDGGVLSGESVAVKDLFAVAGYAVAGGLELALWCDLRVAEEDATFGVFCRRWGVPLIDGGTVRLEFTVIRTDPAQTLPGKPIAEPKQWSYTACRVVLAARGVAEMLNKMQELQRVMLDQGVLTPRPPETAANSPEP